MSLKVLKNKKGCQRQGKGIIRLHWIWIFIASGKRQEREFYFIVLANVSMEPNKHMH
jgi:hypothetical protein